MENFIGRNRELVKPSEIKKRRAFPLDLKLLMSDKIFMEAWPDFATELIESPEQSLNILGLAMHQVLFNCKFSIIANRKLLERAIIFSQNLINI